MNKESKQPREYDLVLGGDNPPPIDGLVLGGIEGVRDRLSSDKEDVVIAAIKDAINYGKEGEDLLFEIVETRSGNVLWEAFDLLWDTFISVRQQELLKYLPYLIKDSVYRWDRWQRKNSDIKIDFRGANFRNADFVGIELEGLSFSEANLEEANFEEANLKNINFSKANLKNANFSNARLHNIDFNEANLSETKFNRTDFRKIDFSGENLTEADFSGATIGRSVNLENANLTNAIFDDTYLRGANLTNANLTNAYLCAANLAYAKLEGAILEGANLEGAAIRGTVLCDYDRCYEGDSYYEGSWE